MFKNIFKSKHHTISMFINDDGNYIIKTDDEYTRDPFTGEYKWLGSGIGTIKCFTDPLVAKYHFTRLEEIA